MTDKTKAEELVQFNTEDGHTGRPFVKITWVGEDSPIESLSNKWVTAAFIQWDDEAEPQLLAAYAFDTEEQARDCAKWCCDKFGGEAVEVKDIEKH